MTDFVWPSDIVPHIEGFNILPHTGGSQSPFTRATKVYGLSAPLWSVEIAFRGGYNSEVWGTEGVAVYGPRVEAQIDRLRGRLNRIALWDFRREGASPWLFNYAISAGADTVRIVGSSLSVGDYIGGDERPHRVNSVSGSGGEQVVKVEPPFSAAVAPSAVTGQRVYGWFRLTDDDVGHHTSEVGQLTTYGLSLLEDPQVSAFAPSSLFADSEEGFIFNVQDLSTLFSDTAGTVPAEVGDPVGKMLDLSGNGNHAVAPSDARRPYLRQKPDGRYYLDFAFYEGSARRMNVSSFALTASGEFQAAAAITPRNVVSDQSILDAYSGTANLRQLRLIVRLGQVEAYGYDTSSTAVLAETSIVPNVDIGRTATFGMQVRDDLTVQGYTNGVPGQRTAMSSLRQATNGITIGALNSADTNFLNAEFFGAIYRAGPELSDDEMRRMMDYLGGLARAKPGAATVDYFGTNVATWAWYEKASGYPHVYSSTLNETWLTWESYDSRRLERYFSVTTYDHATEEFGPVYRVGYSKMIDDSHGVPSLVRDGFGYWHLFGGAHGSLNPDMMHFKTVNPDDPSEWEEQDRIIGDYTYPHPIVIGTEMWLSMRRTITASTKHPLDMVRGDIASDGTITWDPEIMIVDFGADSRTYNFKNEARGTDIHMIMTKADYDDDERVNIYYLIYDTLTGDISNLAGSYTAAAGTMPIDLTEMDTNFRLHTTTAAEHAVMDFVWDPITAGLMHLVYGDATDWIYVPYTNGVAGSPVTIASREGRDDGALVARSDGSLVFLYGLDDSSLWSRYGNIHQRIRSAGGVWGTDTIVSEGVAKAMGAPIAIKDGHADARFAYTEIGQSESTEEPDIRLYLYGDSGAVTRPHVGPDEAVLYFDDSLSPTAPLGAEVGMVELRTPLASPITRNIEVVGDAPFTVEDGYLKVNGELSEGSYSITLRGRDYDGIHGEATLAVNVLADPAYTWANSEGRFYVERTGVYWSAARKAALDTFISALKTAGVWNKLDVLVPPMAFSPHAGLINLVQDAYHGTMVHGFRPMMFSPSVDHTAYPPGNFWYGREGSLAYIDTGFNPTVGSPDYTQNSASIGLRSIGGTSTGAVMGWYDGTDGTTLQPRNSSGQMAIRVNQASTQGLTAAASIASANGLFAANRSGSTSIQAYANGAAVALDSGGSTASTAVNNATLRIGNVVAGSFPSYKWDGYFIGGSLSSTEHGNLYTAWAAYEAAMQALL